MVYVHMYIRVLEDLDCADDISLLYSWQKHAQTELSRLLEQAEKTNLKVNKKDDWRNEN